MRIKDIEWDYHIEDKDGWPGEFSPPEQPLPTSIEFSEIMSDDELESLIIDNLLSGESREDFNENLEIFISNKLSERFDFYHYDFTLDYNEHEIDNLFKDVKSKLVNDKSLFYSKDSNKEQITEESIKQCIDKYIGSYNLQGVEITEEDLFNIEEEINYGASLDDAVITILNNISKTLEVDDTSIENRIKEMSDASKGSDTHKSYNHNNPDIAI